MGQDSPYIKSTLDHCNLPRIISAPSPLPPYTPAPPSGELNGRDVVNVIVTADFTDGHQEECRATVKGWTAEAVHCVVHASAGNYIAWIRPDRVRRLDAPSEDRRRRNHLRVDDEAAGDHLRGVADRPEREAGEGA